MSEGWRGRPARVSPRHRSREKGRPPGSRTQQSNKWSKTIDYEAVTTVKASRFDRKTDYRVILCEDEGPPPQILIFHPAHNPTMPKSGSRAGINRVTSGRTANLLEPKNGQAGQVSLEFNC